AAHATDTALCCVWRSSAETCPAPEGEVLSTEIRDQTWAAHAALPLRQRSVIVLRDVEGCASEEVCEILDTSPASKRVLLHRARVAVRERLKGYFETARRSV